MARELSASFTTLSSSTLSTSSFHGRIAPTSNISEDEKLMQAYGIDQNAIDNLTSTLSVSA
jgi:hypothetical protein